MHDFVGAKEVLSKERLRELSERSNWPAVRHLATHWGGMVMCGFALLENRRHLVVCAIFCTPRHLDQLSLRT